MSYKSKSISSSELEPLGSICVVMFPKETYDTISEHAKVRDMNFNEFISKALDFYLKNGG